MEGSLQDFLRVKHESLGEWGGLVGTSDYLPSNAEFSISSIVALGKFFANEPGALSLSEEQLAEDKADPTLPLLLVLATHC